MSVAAVFSDTAFYRCPSCGWVMARFRGILVADERCLSRSALAALDFELAAVGLASRTRTEARPEAGSMRAESPVVSTSRVRRTFGDRAARWGTIRESFISEGRSDRRLRDSAIRAILESDRDVLDIGCGTGGLLIDFARTTRGRVVGVDASFEMLGSALERIGTSVPDREVSLIWAPAERVPLPDQHFDLITAELLLHHVRRPQRALREMARLARPGATIFAQVPGPNYQAAYPPTWPTMEGLTVACVHRSRRRPPRQIRPDRVDASRSCCRS